VGLEPACLLSLRDEYKVLGLGDGAQRLSENALLLEEFLLREHRAGKLKLALTPLPGTRVLVHGHCHQKAFDAFAPRARGAEAHPRSDGGADRIELLRNGGNLRIRRIRITMYRCGWPSCLCFPQCVRHRPTR
jgi:hypothetical protein